jgi:phosphoserine phosphatase RsbU/P
MSSLLVRQVMDVNPVTVRPDCPIQDALQLMNERRIGSVLITEPPDQLVGIFTDRDLIRRISTAGVNWQLGPISQWMTTKPHVIAPEVGWDEAVGMMERMRVRHLPVVQEGRLIGLLSTRLLMARRTDFLNRSIEARTDELRQAYDQLLARDAEMLHYLRTAGRLQTKLLLPHAPPDWPELQWAVHYAPLDHLGGDYYDFATPDEHHLGILIADASGHSIPAAMVAIMTRFVFAEVSAKTVDPGDVLNNMNRRLQDLTDERFVTAFYGVIDRRTGVFSYATAGHPPPLRFNRKLGKVQPLSSSGFILGIMPQEVYVTKQVVLEPGDKICFYTDGLIEARDEIGELFGVQRLNQCLQTFHSLPAQEMLQAIMNTQQQFSGTAALTDDLTLFVMDVLAEESPE